MNGTMKMIPMMTDQKLSCDLQQDTMR